MGKHVDHAVYDEEKEDGHQNVQLFVKFCQTEKAVNDLRLSVFQAPFAIPFDNLIELNYIQFKFIVQVMPVTVHNVYGNKANSN